MVDGRNSRTRRRGVALLLGLMASLGLTGLALAQKKNGNEIDIKPRSNILDPDEIYDDKGNPKADSKLWVLDFKFKPLRSIKVDIPGRGEQVCWYLWYQVTNLTSQPHTFVPDFELIATDTGVKYKDEILPKVQQAIIDLEDPTGVLKIKNSVTMTREPIPAARPNAVSKSITGVAIFTDPNEPSSRDDAAARTAKAKLPKFSESNYFSVFVSGLSNGWAETDDGVVRRKTLQLNFRRFGDGALGKDHHIRYLNYEWIYRPSKLDAKKLEEGTKPDKGKTPDAKDPMKPAPMR